MKRTKFYKHKIINFLNVQKIVTVHYQEIERGYVSKEEAHDFWEINYADGNAFTLITSSGTHVVQNGEMAFIKPDEPHRIICDNEASVFIISFDCRSECMSFFEDKILLIPSQYRYLLQNVMTEAKETFVIPDFDPDLKKLERLPYPNLGGEQVLKNQLELLLIYLIRQAHNQHTNTQYFLSKITDSNDLQDEIICFLKSKICDTFSLDELCEKLHYGKTRLCSFFKEKTGETIYQTYMKLKIDEEKNEYAVAKAFLPLPACFVSIPSRILVLPLNKTRDFPPAPIKRVSARNSC